MGCRPVSCATRPCDDRRSPFPRVISDGSRDSALILSADGEHSLVEDGDIPGGHEAAVFLANISDVRATDVAVLDYGRRMVQPCV